MIPTRDIVEQLAATGSIMTHPVSPLVHELVGALLWADDHTVLWFTAFGENARDAHLVRFDEVEIHPLGVRFVRGNTILALLTPIEKAAVDDVDDYRIAWRLWLELLPLREPAIEAVFDSLLQGEPATPSPSRASPGSLAPPPGTFIDALPPSLPSPLLSKR